MLRYKKEIVFKNLEQELEKISEKLESISLPSGFLQSVLYIISELFSNVKEHSRAKRVVTGIKIGSKAVVIEIADNGIGFRRSYINKKIYPKDDFSAIEFALSGLSAKGGQERGFGLYSIKKLVEKLGGRMTIKTGLAEAIFERNKIVFHKLPKEKQGTDIGLAMPVKNINFYKIIK